VIDCVSEAIARYEQRGVPWPCGTWENAADPSLFVGESGIGHFLLRLVRPDVPPILLLAGRNNSDAGTSSSLELAQTAPAPIRRQTSVADLRQEYIATHFGLSLSIALTSMRLREEIGRYLSDCSGATSVDFVREFLEAAAQRWPTDHLSDAVSLEAALLDTEKEILDFGYLWLRDQVRVPVQDVNWSSVRMALAQGARFQSHAYDWREWNSSSSRPPKRRSRPMVIVVYQTANGSSWMPITPWERSVLTSLDQASTLDQVVQTTFGNDVGSGNQRIHSRILKCIQAAYADGFVVIDQALN
jgi:hypothetical protein